jgi:hypothetical protein
MSTLKGVYFGDFALAVIIIGHIAHEVLTEDGFPSMPTGSHEHNPRIQIDLGVGQVGKLAISLPRPTQIGHNEIGPTSTYVP